MTGDEILSFDECLPLHMSGEAILDLSPYIIWLEMKSSVDECPTLHRSGEAFLRLSPYLICQEMKRLVYGFFFPNRRFGFAPYSVDVDHFRTCLSFWETAIETSPFSVEAFSWNPPYSVEVPYWTCLIVIRPLRVLEERLLLYDMITFTAATICILLLACV